MRHAELHLHDSYSLLDGLSTPEEYMARAKEVGVTHLAQTNHGTLSGHRHFQRAAQEAGITPILGVEAYFTHDRTDRTSSAKRADGDSVYNHLTIIAQNESGLQNLNDISTEAWVSGFYQKPRIDFDLLEQHSDGLIVLSGCMSGMIPRAIQAGNVEYAEQLTQRFRSLLGERFFIEVMSSNPKELNTELVRIANRYGILPVVTSDCHHARPEDLAYQEAMLILNTNPNPAKTIDFKKSQRMELLERLNYLYPERKMSFQEFDLYLHSYEQHMAGMEAHGLPESVVSNTMIVANMVEGYPMHEGLDLLPRPKNASPDTILEAKCRAGMDRRGLTGKPEYESRLREELDVIKSKDFSTYFLIESDTVDWGRSQGIRFGPGRGSGAGSLVNYVLGITGIDPLPDNLLFFRFIDPGRDDMPDIDTDVEVHRRSEVKDYLLRKFKHVASIATFGTWQGKQAVRDAARVFRVPLADVNKALKGADWPSSVDFFVNWDKTVQGVAFRRDYPEVVEFAKFLYGRIRTQGMHAGGLVVSSEPINKYAPIQTAKDNSDPSGTRIPLVAYDMDEAAKIGFVKYDFLGLKALSIVTDTLSLIKDRHGVELDLESLSLDDKKVFNNLSEGNTVGVFQCEAVPYTNLLIKMGGVSKFDELVASNALVRPGAMNSSAGKSFIERKAGREMVEYHHPTMTEFTRDTYGVVIYQEQVMLTMTELAGMSMSDANKVRKIIGKKRDVSEFEAYREQFIEGASQHIKRKHAEQLWHDFEAHAGYSFNKSHAVAYSVLSYWTAWLKEYYPIEFMTATLRNEGNSDSLLDYLMEAKRLGIRIMLPHINVSGLKFEIQSDDDGDYIRFGLSNIKYISDTLARRIINARPFSSYAEFSEEVLRKGSGLNRRVLQATNAVGAAAFRDNPLSGNERENLFEFLNIPAFETNSISPKVRAQFRPLEDYEDDETFICMGMVRGIKTGAGWARIEMVDETGSAGIFASPDHGIEAGKMYVVLVSNNRVAKHLSVEAMSNDAGGLFQEFLEADSLPDVPDGMMRVVSMNPRITKAGKRMGDVVLANEQKELTSALIFPGNFARIFARCQEGATVDIQLKATKEGSLFVDNIL